jgi:hypothetical protein
MELIMTANIGSADKVIRLVLGVVIVLLGVYFQSWWGLVGLIPIGTAFMNFCPLYVPFKISTKK